MNQIVKFRPFPATKVFSNGLLDEFFNRNFSDFVGSDAVVNQPAVNVVETKDNFRVEIAAPGFDKQDFSITTEKDYVTIEAKREASTEKEGERYTRREFRFETFKRSYKLPETVNQDLISAVYENGILNVTLPKKEEVKPVTKAIAIG
jgi:HSP20 family protein